MATRKSKSGEKDSKIFENVERLIKTLGIVPRQGRISVADLHARLASLGFKVTRRTVQRDLNHLAGPFGISSDGARPQGWFWPKDAVRVDIPGLDLHTALAFKMAAKYLEPLLPASTFEYLNPWFRDAGEVLARKDGGFAGWVKKVRVLPKGFPLLPPRVRTEVQETLYEALFRGYQARVRYRPAGSRTAKEHLIHPMALVVRDHVAYLVCRIGDHDYATQLVLNRFMSAELLKEKAKGLPGFDIDEYIGKGEFGFPKGDGRIALDVRIHRGAAIHFLENRLSEDQEVIEDTPDHLRFRATVPDTAELRWWVLSLGQRAEVLGPRELRAEMAGIVAEMAAAYSGDPR